MRFGTASPAALVARAAELGMPALALTDRDGLYGAFKHVQACVEAGVKPILGAELAVRPDEALAGGERQAGTERPERPECRPDLALYPEGRVTLLAEGRHGWASLCRLVSAAHAWADSGEAASAEASPSVTPALIAQYAP